MLNQEICQRPSTRFAHKGRDLFDVSTANRTLRYGQAGQLAVEVPTEKLHGALTRGPSRALADVRAAAAQALAAPLEYPPLSAAVVPGDRVVLALDEAVPQSASLVAAVVDVLLAQGVEAVDITVLLAEGLPTGEPTVTGSSSPPAPSGFPFVLDPTAALAEEVRLAIQRVVHNPQNQDDLAYLAATESGHRIYLNRHLVEADFVLPIGCIRQDPILGMSGTSTGIYPRFSDAATWRRFRAAGRTDHAVDRFAAEAANPWRQEVDEVSWLLGIQLALQVVPAISEMGVPEPSSASSAEVVTEGSALCRVETVLAGAVPAVQRLGQSRFEQYWICQMGPLASVVVAGLDGGPEQQRWPQFGRALRAATRCVQPRGAVVLCTELGLHPVDRTLGPGLQMVIGSDQAASARGRIRRELPEDFAVALALVDALQGTSVYLMSHLEPDLVEDLGMTPVAEQADVLRLIERSPSCTLLGGAQFAWPEAT